MFIFSCLGKGWIFFRQSDHRLAYFVLAKTRFIADVKTLFTCIPLHTHMEMYKKIDGASDPQKVWHSSKTYYVNVHVQTNCNKNQPDLNVIRHPFIIHRTEKKIENELLL